VRVCRKDANPKPKKTDIVVKGLGIQAQHCTIKHYKNKSACVCVCVYVCVREREKESVCVCVHVCVMLE